jgi:hypothetical protein
VALKRVRASKQEGGDYPEFYRILRGLHKTARQGVQFVTERVGSDVFVSSLDADTGGAATLLRTSAAGAHIKYAHGGREVAVGPERVCDISEVIAPAGVRTRSDAANSGVELLTRPEVEAAELTRWREELRLSREAERAATERATRAEACAARSAADAARSKAMISTAQQYGRECELERDKATVELDEGKKQALETLNVLKVSHACKVGELNSTIKGLEQKLSDSNAKLHRAVHSRIESESYAAGRIETAESKAESTVEELKRQMTSAVEDAKAGTIDQMATLSGLCDVLCPESAVSNIIHLDALPTSDAATDEKSRRRADYARVTSELVCATIRFAAADDDDRISQLVGDIPKVTLSFFFEPGMVGASDLPVGMALSTFRSFPIRLDPIGRFYSKHLSPRVALCRPRV